MPELPEVEQFRQLLLPLCVADGSKSKLSASFGGSDNPPRKWLSQQDLNDISKRFCYCKKVVRKGKLLCLVLYEKEKKKKEDGEQRYLFLHMGMTGCISTPNRTVRLENAKKQEEDTFPPKYTHLVLQTDTCRVAFADSRKFGSATLSDTTEALAELAPDALNELTSAKESIVNGLMNQRLGIKALLLDQKRIVSGVGNWVADEVLYQVEMHPDQMRLSRDEAETLLTKLHVILKTAVKSLAADEDYPKSWLFPYRWTRKKAGKDVKGRSLSFVTSGGRTSAIVPAIQKLRKRKVSPDDTKSPASKKKSAPAKESQPKETKSLKRKSSGAKRSSSRAIGGRRKRQRSR